MNSAIVLLTLILNLAPLASRFAIIGTVRDENGREIESVRVTLLDDNYRSIRTVFADSSGRFQFRNLLEGKYFVRVDPIGTPYEEQIQSIEFQSMSPRSSTLEEPYTVDFQLKRKRGQAASVASAPGVIFVQEVPANAREHYVFGQRSLKNGNPEMGIQSLKKALEIFPDYFLALELLGTEYAKREDFENALPILIHAIEINRDASKSIYALGVTYLKSNRSAEALIWLQRAAERDAKNANIFMMLGIAYGNTGALSEAENSFKKAYSLAGGDVAEVHYYLAGIHDKQRRYSDAIRELKLFLKQSRDVIDRNLIKRMIERLEMKSKQGGVSY